MAETHRLNLLSPEFKANPYPVYDRLREEAPANRVLVGSEPIWLVTRYEQAAAVVRDSRLRKSRRDAGPQDESGRGSQPEHIRRFFKRFILNIDPPSHTRLRSLGHKAFTPHFVESLRDRVQAIANSLLDAARDRGEMDVIKDYAERLSLGGIVEMLGVPSEDRQKSQRWFQAVVALSRGVTAEGYAKIAPLLEAFLEYIRALVEQRRSRPEGDLLSALVHVEEEGGGLTEDELLAMVILLVIAGYDTTTSLIGNGTLALLEHPLERERLRSDPSQIKPAIEEILRYDGPAEMTPLRYAAEDIEIAGVVIPKGEAVSAVLTAANRDPAHFPDPGRLDITRAGAKHIAFGGGIHYCFGAPLARLEGQIAINTLLQRMPSLRRREGSKPLEWHRLLFIRGLKQLPVLF
jgi:cytochrome P450